jgi:formate-dependent nitrite reductase membrane component NrfD
MASWDFVDMRRRDLGLEYRPQREWIEGRGILLPFAHFFSGVGAGAWAFSLLFDFRGGLVMALVWVGVLSGLAHLLFLGRWERFWRILKRPHSSWISRGIWGIGVFLAGGLGYTLAGSADTVFGSIMLGLSLVGMVVILLYEGFVYAASRAIPFWNTRLLPVLYVAYGLRGGAALLLVAASLGSGIVDLDAMEAIKLWVVVSTAVLVLLYLVAADRSGGAARRSVRELVAGRISLPFYVGTVAIGIAVPIILGAARELGSFGLPVLGLVGAASLVGDFYVKFCIVKAGIYVPVAGNAALQKVQPDASSLR